MSVPFGGIGRWGLFFRSAELRKTESAQYFLVSAMEPAAEASDEEVNKFYDKV